MLQSKPKQLLIKYMTSLRQAVELRPEDTGSIRLAMSMALEELQDEHRQQLNDLDDIAGDLIRERDELRAASATDAAEILRLQTMEDRLIRWVAQHVHMPDGTDIADVVIAMLERGGATVSPPPAHTNGSEPQAMRYSGRRIDMSDDEIRTVAIDVLRSMAAELGRTPTKREFEESTGNGKRPSVVTIKQRTGMSWSDLIAAADLEPNRNIAEIKAAAKQEREAGPENGTSNFRGQ
jgi:hypothetical protein